MKTEQVKITVQNPIREGDVLENGGVVELSGNKWLARLPSKRVNYYNDCDFIGFTVTREIKSEIVSGIRLFDFVTGENMHLYFDGAVETIYQALLKSGVTPGDKFHVIKAEEL